MKAARALDASQHPCRHRKIEGCLRVRTGCTSSRARRGPRVSRAGSRSCFAASRNTGGAAVGAPACTGRRHFPRCAEATARLDQVVPPPAELHLPGPQGNPVGELENSPDEVLDRLLRRAHRLRKGKGCRGRPGAARPRVEDDDFLLSGKFIGLKLSLSPTSNPTGSWGYGAKRVVASVGSSGLAFGFSLSRVGAVAFRA